MDRIGTDDTSRSEIVTTDPNATSSGACDVTGPSVSYCRQSSAGHRGARAWGALLALLVAISMPALCQAPAAPPDSALPPSSASTVTVEVDPQSSPSKPAADKAAKTEKAKEREHRGSFVIAPLPISSPAIGSGIVPVVGYIFPFNKADKVSPPSVVGAAGLLTNNGTRVLAVGGQLYFKENRYQITAGFVRGNINYDLYGSQAFSGLKLPLKQTSQGFRGEFLRNVGRKFFLGPRLLTGHSTLTVRPTNVVMPLPPDLGFQTTLTAIGLRVTRDTSLNRFYPVDGMFFTFTADFFSQTLGSKYSFQSYRTTFSKYWSLSGKQVLAYNAYFCATGGKPPFYGNCIYGTSNQLRGYTAGKYFDRYMTVTQLEYRLVLPMRFGLAAFGGVGEVVPGGDQLLFRNSNFLPSGGAGLRFDLSKKYHVNLRADIARGRDGHTFSMGVGEAF